MIIPQFSSQRNSFCLRFGFKMESDVFMVGLMCDTIIPVADSRGYIEIKDVNVGDMVFDERGYPVEVLDIGYDKGDIFKVIFADNSYLFCGIDQTFAVRNRAQHYARDSYRVLSLNEMVIHGLFANVKNSGKVSIVKQWYVPKSQPLVRANLNLDIDPYLLGLYLGDGSFRTKRFAVNIKDEDVLGRVAAIIHAPEIVRKSSSWCFVKDYNSNNKPVFFLLSDIDSHDYLVENGSVPDIYFMSSIEQRLELLKGLMDAEGSVSGNDRLCCKYTTSNDNLALDVMKLATSLGIRASMSTEDRSVNFKDNYRPEISVYLSLQDELKTELFFADRHISKIYNNMRFDKKFKKHYDDMAVANAEPVGDRNKLISLCVDSVSNVYQVTDRHLIVHGHQLNETDI